MVTLEQFKTHLRHDEGSDEDEYLLTLLEASRETLEGHIGISLDDIVIEYGGCPSRLQLAIMILAATFYNNREVVAYSKAEEVSFSYKTLIAKYIKYRRCEQDY